MNILIAVAHPDDEVIGVGGTIVKHVRQRHIVHVCFFTEGATARGGSIKKQLACARKACQSLGVDHTHFFGYRDQRLDTYPLLDLNRKLESLVKKIRPEIIYTHFYGDLNMDHRMVFDSSMIASRPLRSTVKNIFCFETLSSTEWDAPGRFPFTPNVYENIEDYFDKKVEAFRLYAQTPSNEVEKFPHPRSIEGLATLAKKRGSEAGFLKAEAFMLIRQLND